MSSTIDILSLVQPNHYNPPTVVDVVELSRFSRQLTTNILAKKYILLTHGHFTVALKTAAFYN